MAASLVRSASESVKRGARGIASRGPGAEGGSRGPGAEGGSRGPGARTAADPRVVTVSYQPRRDGRPDPGEVVWTWIPYEDNPAEGKDRPAVAIGFAGSTLALVPFTSHDQLGRPHTYEIGTGGWDSSGRASWVKLDRLVGVDPASVRREGATLDQARFTELVARLHAVHGGQLRLTG